MDLNNIILFDDDCLLCNRTIQWILKYDKYEIFKFTSLQSSQGKKILSQFNQRAHSDSVLLIDDGKLFHKSTAALRIVRKIPYFKVLYFLIIVPRTIRDAVYDFIARNRYKWFGKTDNCIYPGAKWKDRFI